MKYTKQELDKIAKETSSFNSFIREVYGKTDGNSWRKGKNLVEEFGIDTSHYKIPKYTKEILEPVVNKSNSMSEVSKHLRIKPGGGSQFFVKQKIKEFGIDCSHFKKHIFPRTKCKTPKEVLVVKPEGSTRTTPYILRRCLIEIGRKYICEAEDCLVSESWLGSPITLQVHHIDGDCLNNKSNNLMFVCPNCHTQTSNWCAKGRTK